MKKYKVLLGFNGLHEITVEADSPKQAEELVNEGDYLDDQVNDKSEEYSIEGCEEV